MRKDQIFFWSIISFVGGVMNGSFFIVQLPAILLCVAIYIAIYSVFPRKTIGIAGILLMMWTGGTFLTLHKIQEFVEETYFYGEEITGIVRIVADPEEKAFFQKIIVHFESCENKRCPKKDILWQAPRTFTLEAGDRFSFSCLLEEPKNFDLNFDYRMFHVKAGISAVCQKATQAEILVEKDTSGTLFALLYKPKHAFEKSLSQSITEPEAGLAKGLLLGGDDYLPRSLDDMFKRLGLTHIVAVSGYNITIIAECFLIVGIALGLWRKQALWAALVIIALFILMIGAPASAVRAGVMAFVVFGALQTGRLSRSVNTLLLAAGIMLLFNPLLLRYDIGFQLSVLATLGIIISSSWQEYYLPHEFFGKSFVEIILMTIAAEIFVLPVILFNFQMFSPLMLVANSLLLPLVPYAMGLSFVAASAFLVLPGLHVIFSWIAYAVLLSMTRLVEVFGGLSFASLVASHFGVLALITWYGVLFFVIVKGEQYRKRKIYAQAFSHLESR